MFSIVDSGKKYSSEGPSTAKGHLFHPPEASTRTFVAEQLIASPMRASLHNACCQKGRGGICPVKCETQTDVILYLTF